MTGQTEYFLQVFQTLGAPLVRAALSQNTSDKPIDPKQTAQVVAELLTKSVQTGINLGALVKLEQHSAQAEAARISLTALGGQLNAALYQQNGQAADPAAMQAMTDGLKPVMDLTAGFEASPDAILRLKTSAPDGSDADQLQSKIQTVQTFVPIIAAARRNSFGQEAEKFAQTTLERLIERAQKLIAAHSTLISENKATERALLGALAQIFCAVHEAQTNQKALSAEALWKEFDLQLSILDTLVGKIMSPSNETVPAPGAPPAPVQPQTQQPQAAMPPPSPPSPPSPTAPAAPPAETSSSVVPPAPPQPDTSEQSPATPPSGAASANPMGFFAKKPATEDIPPAAPPPPPPPPAENKPEPPPLTMPSAEEISSLQLDEDTPELNQNDPAPAEQKPALGAPIEQPLGAAGESGLELQSEEETIAPPPSPVSEQPPAQPPQTPAEAPPELSVAPPPPPPPPAEEESSAAAPPNKANPMSFFTKKQDDED